MKLDVRLLDDREAIDRILRSAEIAPKIRTDTREPGYIEHPLASYWGAWVDETLVGVFLAVRFSRWEIEVHAGIMREGLPHARGLSRLFLARMFEIEDVARVTAYVLSTLPSAGNLCLKLGFEYEGRRRDACRVDGRPCDVLVYGLTRSDRDSTCAAT